MLKTQLLAVTLAAFLAGTAGASAAVVGDGFGLTFNYDVVTAESDSLVFGTLGLLDLPPEQEWSLATGVGAPIAVGDMSLVFDLTYEDASDFDASLIFSLLERGLADGSGTPLEIVGPIYLWFTPQMNPQSTPALVLTENVHWQQQQVGDELRYSIGTGAGIAPITAAALAPSFFPAGNERISDVHWAFDVASVPEPSMLAFLAVGLVHTLLRRR